MKFVARNGGLVVHYSEREEADPELLRTDSINFNAIGINMWTLGLKDGIE